MPILRFANPFLRLKLHRLYATARTVAHPYCSVYTVYDYVKLGFLGPWIWLRPRSLFNIYGASTQRAADLKRILKGKKGSRTLV
jgi:hypothetical protein